MDIIDNIQNKGLINLGGLNNSLMLSEIESVIKILLAFN